MTTRQAYNEALGLPEPEDFLPALERVYCIQNGKDVPEDELTLEKWKEWIGNAPKRERRAWSVNAFKFMWWLSENKAQRREESADSDIPEGIEVIFPAGLVDLGAVIAYIDDSEVSSDDGKFIMPTDQDDIFMADFEMEDSQEEGGDSTLVVNSRWVIPSWLFQSETSAREKLTLEQSLKGAWATWKLHGKEYLKENPKAKNPFGASIEAYVVRPTEISPFKPKKRAVLPIFEEVEVGEARRLIELQAEPPPSTQLHLEIPEIQSHSGAFWLLDLYARAGGAANQRGRGAPWPMRLLVGGVLHLPIDQRDGRWHCFRLPTDDVIRWLRPDGWSQKKSRWEQFPKALEEVNRLGWIPLSGVGRVQVFGVSVIPERPTDPFVEFIARVPPSAAKGARIDWPLLCKYGTESAPLYRAYLTTCAIWRRSASNGQPVTEVIGKALLNADGTPIRKKGKIVRSTTEFKPNSTARYVKGLTKAQLTEAIGLDASVNQNQSDAIKAFKRLEDDGVLDLQTKGRGKYQKYFLFARNQWADAQAEVVAEEQAQKEAEGENRENG